MSRYGYALFFSVLTGGVATGIAAVAIGTVADDPPWAPAASGSVGLTLAVLVFVAVLRATEPE